MLSHLSSYKKVNVKFKLKQRRVRFFKNISRSPKNCILCESWVFYKAPLCKECRKFLYNEYLKSEFEIQNIENYPCYYLWKWTEINDIWIQKLVVAMKDGHNFALYKVFMPWLIKKLKAHSQIKWVTAIPSLSRNHPQALIESFKDQYINIQSFELVKLSKKSQKFRTKFERLKTSFKIHKNSNFKSVLNKDYILILDDVLSTGGSFKGVISALDGKNIQALAVWAYRSKRNF